MNKGRWTSEQKDYVLDSIGKIPLQEICDKLNKSELAVNLFLHRNKIYRGAVVKKNIVLEILRIKFVHPEYQSDSCQYRTGWREHSAICY